MGKRKTGKPQQGIKDAKSTPVSTTPSPLTTLSVRDDNVLGYKIRVLLYDLKNITKDIHSERRLNLTTDEHYISAPYFQPDEVSVVKAARVNTDVGVFIDPAGANDANEYPINENSSSSRLQGQVLDTAIRMIMDTFFEKRRASGDARPCGPHDLAPVYAALFGIDLAELQSEKFLGRLRRAGV